MMVGYLLFQYLSYMGQPVVASVPMSMAGAPMAGMSVVSTAAPMTVAPAAAAVPVSAAVGHLDWAIPQPTRAKYSAVFAQTDRARTGFLAGVQARNILVQSGLAQNVLAQIW